MLPKENRLSKEAFTKIFKTGRRVRGGVLTLVYIKTQSQEKPKLGIVVSKKTIKTAVGRNKIKRQIRNILIQEILPVLKSGLEGVIMVYPGAGEKKFDELRGEIKMIFDKIL